jgi:glycine/D-amino acid oxidase-like deaminating enzyme
MNNGHSPPKTADAVILRAGVMSASIAFHLAQHAGEHHRPGQGSCGAWGECLPRTRASNFRLEHEHIRGVSSERSTRRLWLLPRVPRHAPCFGRSGTICRLSPNIIR